jgi:hypothetical protein
MAATVGAIHYSLQWLCCRYGLQTTSDAFHTVTVLDNVALSAIHASVPPVFDSVVTPVSQPPCDLGPPLPHVVHHPLYQLALLCRYGLMIQGWLQILMIALPALLW